jgi:uncharacterized protein YdhG (YjbR/CyaY superfamily)
MANTTVDEYLVGVPEPHRTTLMQLREVLRELLPQAEEGISYNMPAFIVNGKPVAGYAYFKEHCSYFPHSGSVLPELADELAGYNWSKGTLQFPPDQPLPKDLVRRLVEVMLEQLGF